MLDKSNKVKGSVTAQQWGTVRARVSDLSRAFFNLSSLPFSEQIIALAGLVGFLPAPASHGICPHPAAPPASPLPAPSPPRGAARRGPRALPPRASRPVPPGLAGIKTHPVCPRHASAGEEKGGKGRFWHQNGDGGEPAGSRALWLRVLRPPSRSWESSKGLDVARGETEAPKHGARCLRWIYNLGKMRE